MARCHQWFFVLFALPRTSEAFSFLRTRQPPSAIGADGAEKEVARPTASYGGCDLVPGYKGSACTPEDQLLVSSCNNSCACLVRSEPTLVRYCDPENPSKEWCRHHSNERLTAGKATCSENIKACAADIPYVEGLALIEHNYIYRLSDLLNHSGTRWRTDSVAILADPKFRGTLLRRVLENTATLKGQFAGNIAEEDFMAAASNEGAPGYVCTVGAAGPSGLDLGESFEANETVSRALVQFVGEMVKSGECERAHQGDLVVGLRMGDLTPEFGKIVESVNQYIALGVERGDTPITRIVFNGVLNFGGYTVADAHGGIRENYEATDGKIQASLDVIAALSSHYRNFTHLDVAVRSKPDADADLCYMATSPALVVDGHSGFGRLVIWLRNRLMNAV